MKKSFPILRKIVEYQQRESEKLAKIHSKDLSHKLKLCKLSAEFGFKQKLCKFL